MHLILDTHAVLWHALDDTQLGPAAKRAIHAERGEIYISPASYWEVAIKICAGKYRLESPFEEFWRTAIEDGGFAVLPIEISHAAKLATLPHIHRDTFDRLLVAQALCENLTIVSNDSILDRYGVERIW